MTRLRDAWAVLLGRKVAVDSRQEHPLAGWNYTSSTGILHEVPTRTFVSGNSVYFS